MRTTLLILFVATFVAAGCRQTKPGTATDTRLALNVPAHAREVNIARKLESRRIGIVEQFLIGEPGVIVDGRRVRIHGSQRGPLWVIDGMYTDTPGGLNPYDVSKMWIVADGFGYGRRGSSGVVVVETKVEQ